MGDLWDDIKSGAAKVTGAVVTAVAAGAHAVISTLKGTFTGLISTIEQAALLVQGIFNEIATAIHRVVEAVSFLFDWGKIVDLHDQIRDQMTGAWTSLAKGGGGLSFANMKAMLDSWFADAEGKIDDAFKSAKEKLGTQTPLAVQAENSGRPNAVVGAAQDNWLLGKCQDNMLPKGGRELSVPGAATGSIAWPDIQLGQDVLTKFDTFVSQLGQTLSDEARKTVDQIREMLDFQSSPGLLARGFAVVLEILQGAAEVAIKAGKLLADFLIDLLQAVMTAVYDAMTRTSIEIPYVSDFYRWATKRDPTLIDMFALVTAIPAGFALGLLSREPAYASRVSPLPPGQQQARGSLAIPTLGWMEIVAGCAQGIWGVFGGIVSALDLRQSLQFAGGGGLSAIAKVRFWVTAVFGFGARIALLVPLVYLFLHGPKPNAVGWILWIVPGAVLLCDFLYLWFREDNPDGSLLLAILALCLGVAMPLLGGWEYYESPKHVADWLGLGFAISVGFSMIARGVVIAKAPQVKYGAIAASAALLLISGGFEIAKGAVTD